MHLTNKFDFLRQKTVSPDSQLNQYLFSATSPEGTLRFIGQRPLREKSGETKLVCPETTYSVSENFLPAVMP